MFFVPEEGALLTERLQRSCDPAQVTIRLISFNRKAQKAPIVFGNVYETFVTLVLS